ncbi:MAG: hypothetical protein ACLFUR_03585 [Candidatus Hadarchaeia archaeon]
MFSGDRKGKIGPFPNGFVIFLALLILALAVISLPNVGREERREPNGVQIPERRNAITRTLRIEVTGEVMYYRETYIWSENDYVNIKDKREEFEELQKDLFKDKYDIEPEFTEIRFFDTDRSTLFQCEVWDKVGEEENVYVGNFDWFLNPLGLNFVDNEFEETNANLIWNNELDEISTGIVLDLPPENATYEIGGDSFGHGATKVWWTPTTD